MGGGTGGGIGMKRRLFIEADELGQWVNGQPFGPHECWQDHGAGLLLTLAKKAGKPFDVLSLKAMHSWAELRMHLKGYDVLAMNVRSWRYIYAKRAAEIFKLVNPNGEVWTGGMHATVAPQEMLDVRAFDWIISGEGEGTWEDLLDGRYPATRLSPGSRGRYENLDDLPFIDRSLWPRTPGNEWPLEGSGGWGPGTRAATMLSSTACPFNCSFCAPAERNHFGGRRRRSVGHVLADLAHIKARWGEYTSVVFHDSEFLLEPVWLNEFLVRYPAEVGLPFWASCRADIMSRWPELTEALIRQAGWHTISIGLESGSQRVLDIMNKQTTVEQNMAGIELVNRIGDDLVAEGKRPPVIFANVMLATPGEDPEDAFATVRMLGRIKRCLPSISWFTPYPGSALGDKIISEGLSLDSHKRYLRYPNEAKVLGIDYQFYVDLANGRYDRETGVNMRELMSRQGQATEALV